MIMKNMGSIKETGLVTPTPDQWVFAKETHINACLLE